MLSCIAVLSSCVEKPTAPPELLQAQYPPAPESLGGVQDSGIVKLTWSYAAPPAKEFRIYRQAETEAAAELIGTSTTNSYNDDSDLVEAQEYSYQVSAVSNAGYESQRSDAVRLIYIASSAPAAVFLFTPVARDTFPVAVQLSWAGSADSATFAAYELFRSQAPQVDFNSTPVAIITSRGRLAYLDVGLQAGTLYGYRIYVFNRAGFYSASNVVTVRTPADAPPQSVALALPAIIDATALRLSWARSADADFASYRVYRSTQSPVDVAGQPRAIMNEVATTTYEDRGLTTGATYFYRVAVYDRGGNSSISNEVSGATR